MKILLKFLILTISLLLSQNIKIISDEALTTVKDGKYFYPSFINNNKIIFSSENYNGLWLQDIEKKELSLLTDNKGAGYLPIVINENMLFYKEDKYIEGKKKSALWSINISNLQKELIEDNMNNLKLIRDNNEIIYLKSDNLNIVSYNVNNELSKKSNKNNLVTIDNSKIVLIIKENKKILEPLGKKNYIWASLSPDNKKILFTCAGLGTYISDLEGKIIVELGYINFPSWSSDGNWILGMQDYDNGKEVTKSNLIITKSDNSKSFQFENVDGKKAVYPKWGLTDDKIIYNTTDGIIYLMNIKYE